VGARARPLANGCTARMLPYPLVAEAMAVVDVVRPAEEGVDKLEVEDADRLEVEGVDKAKVEAKVEVVTVVDSERDMALK